MKRVGLKLGARRQSHKTADPPAGRDTTTVSGDHRWTGHRTVAAPGEQDTLGAEIGVLATPHRTVELLDQPSPRDADEAGGDRRRPGIIVYADFACPQCYLTSLRVDALATTGVCVDWRAIDHRAGPYASRQRTSATEQASVGRQIRDLEPLLLPQESVRWHPLSTLPRTEAAVVAYAEAYGSPVADDVRRLIFSLCWEECLDIGDPEVLRTPLAGPFQRSGSTVDPIRDFGYAISSSRGPITLAAYRRIKTWKAEWQSLDEGSLPMVLTEGKTLCGLDALAYVAKQIRASDPPRRHCRDDPGRYPPVSDRPPMGWVSQVGGRWRTAYMRPSP